MNHTWSYLIDGDEQPDQPNSQTCMEWCHECTALFLGFDINTTAYYLDLHFLQLKSSLTYQIINSYYCSFSSTSSMVMSFLTKICIVEHTYNRLGYRPDQYSFFKKCTILGLFYFWSFQANITIFTTIQCEKCPSSIRCHDLIPRPLVRESPPVTTRPV